LTWTTVARKELVVEGRARETLVPVLLVGLLVVTVCLLALHDVAERRAATAATLWLALAFGAGVGAARAFGAEKDRGTLDVLLGLPMDRGHVYLGKALASFVTLLVVALVTLACYLAASGDAPTAAAWAPLLLFLALGALGLAATGTMLSVLVAQTRARDVLLPVLLLPLLVPLLLSGIEGTESLLAGDAFSAWRGELLVLAGNDVAFLAASWLLFGAAVGE
jgi:heme exporter protein B